MRLLEDRVPIVSLALRAAHRWDSVNHALGTIVGRYIALRLGARMMGNSGVLVFDDMAPDLADDIRAIVRWTHQHPEAASGLLIFCEWAEDRHPESRALRTREILSATRYPPGLVIRGAAALKRRMGRT